MSDDLSLDDLEVAGDQKIVQRDHFSWSQINMYLRCPLQYYFRYIMGFKQPPAASLVFGSTSHEALEHNYKQKIESRADLAVKDVQDFWASRWDANLKTSVGLEFDEDENRATLLDVGVRLIGEYQTLVAPTIQPMVVEEAFTITIPNVDKPIIGRIDLIDDKDILIDHKNVKREGTQAKVDVDGQLTMYDMVHVEKYQCHAKGLEMDYLVKTKKPKFVRLSTTRTDDQISRFKNTVASIATAIKQESFYPNNQNFMCSKAFCGYWDKCEGYGKKA